MKFTFTELDQPTDALRHGGKLEIEAETQAEVLEVIEHFRLFKESNDVETLKARIAALEQGSYVHVMTSKKRPVYEVSSCLDFAFMTPYRAWALRCFGYDGVFPDLELTRKYGGLRHTNYQARMYTECEHICFDAFTSTEPWNGKDAQDYAESTVSDYIGEEFGIRYNEPEFIQGSNNHYKKNPDYLKRHRATPAATNAGLKRAFFAWWVANHANAAQKAIIAGNEEIAQGATYMRAFEFERAESHIYHAKTAQDYKALSFAEFAALGATS